MRYERLLASVLGLGGIALVAGSCSSSSTGGDGGAGGRGSGPLYWFTTCGDPVCGGDDSGAPACTTEKDGEPCTLEGWLCSPGVGCGVKLLCTSSDPKLAPGGCPVSRARYKKDIRYLSDAELSSVHDELMTMRLAQWRYTSEADGARGHLGFIIDDNPASASVDASGEKVDLYGYTSMAVAAAQVQEKRIEALERELRALRDELAALRKQGAR